MRVVNMDANIHFESFYIAIATYAHAECTHTHIRNAQVAIDKTFCTKKKTRRWICPAARLSPNHPADLPSRFIASTGPATREQREASHLAVSTAQSDAEVDGGGEATGGREGMSGGDATAAATGHAATGQAATRRGTCSSTRCVRRSMRAGCM